MKPLLAKLLQLIREADTTSAELVIVLLGLMYGSCFLLFPESVRFPAFRQLGALAPHYIWGVVLIALSLADLWMILTEGRARGLWGAVTFGVWTFVTAMIAATNVRDPPLYSALGRALVSLWVSLRHRGG